VQTPPAIVERLNHELNEVLRSEDVKAKMAEQGAIGGSGTAADFGRFVAREQERYARIVKAANIRE
jgi:tripartite-type tricarboxylate transporter receptor subunit TctC